MPGPVEHAGGDQQRLDEGGLARPGRPDQHHVADRVRAGRRQGHGPLAGRAPDCLPATSCLLVVDAPSSSPFTRVAIRTRARRPATPVSGHGGRHGENASYAPGPPLLRRRTGWPRRHRRSASARCSARSSVDGGVHPRFGTRNMILPLTDGTYLEVVEVLDHPASDKAPFGQAVRARSALGGGWLGWVVAVDDIAHGRGAARPRVRQRQPAPPRRHRAALAADRRQGPAGRPAAAVLHPVGRPRRDCTRAPAPPATSRWRAWRSPATRTGSASGSARPSRQPLEDVKVEWVAPQRHPRHHRRAVPDPERPRPASEPRPLP